MTTLYIKQFYGEVYSEDPVTNAYKIDKTEQGFSEFLKRCSIKICIFFSVMFKIKMSKFRMNARE